MELRALVEMHGTSLASLTEELDACSEKIAALCTEAHVHILAILRYKAAMSPARLLPPELLAKIFEHAREMGWTRASIVASHVCSTWRAAAHPHPSVWSRITINLDMQDPIRWAEHWLFMTRQASLHVTISHTFPTTTLGEVIALLLGRSEQWVSLTLELELTDTQRVLAACTARFTRLRSVKISLFMPDEDIATAESTADFANGFRDAPSLASVSVAGIVPPRDLPPRLTSLRIAYNDFFGPSIGTTGSVIEALRNLPN